MLAKITDTEWYAGYEVLQLGSGDSGCGDGLSPQSLTIPEEQPWDGQKSQSDETQY